MKDSITLEAVDNLRRVYRDSLPCRCPKLTCLHHGLLRIDKQTQKAIQELIDSVK